MAGDRFSGKQIFSGFQWRLISLVPGGGLSAYLLCFGPDPVDLFGWADKDEDMLFARDASLSGRRWPHDGSSA